jgi:DNA-binding beta-propeller fold protein YncE
VAITPDGQFAWVVDFASGTVVDYQGVNTSSPSVLSTLTVPGTPWSVAITPDGTYAYVTYYVFDDDNSTYTSYVAVYTGADSTSPTLLTTLDLGLGTIAQGITIDGSNAFVANGVDLGTGSVYVINGVDTNDPVLSGTVLDMPAGFTPEALATSPDGSFVFVANDNQDNSDAGDVTTIEGADTASPFVGSSITAGLSPRDITVSLDGQYVYVANLGSDDVSQFSGADSGTGTLTLLNGIAVGGQPIALAITPDSGTLYVANSGSPGDVAVVTGADTTDPALTSTASADLDPNGLAVVPDQAPVAALSATEESGTTLFTAAASTVAYGTIAQYVYDFGDGSADVTTASDTINHDYSGSGPYTATVTETSSAGTSTTVTYTGRTVSNNGGPSATASIQVTPIGGGLTTTPTQGMTPQGTAYSGQFTTVGGTGGPVTYSQSTGSPDITVSSSGAIAAPASLAAGTYMASGTTSDEIDGPNRSHATAGDGDGDTGTFNFTLTVYALVTTPASANTPQGTAYSGQLSTTGGGPGTTTYGQSTGSPDITVNATGGITAPGTLNPGTYTATGTDSQPVEVSADRSHAVAQSGTYTGSWSFSLTVYAPTARRLGFRDVAADGGVFSFGADRFFGSLPGLTPGVVGPTHDVVGITSTADNGGYWLAGADGGVFGFGDAPYLGSLPGDGVSAHDIVDVASTNDGAGYWLVGADGGVFSFGAAHYYGSLPGSGITASDVVGLAATPDGGGYWLVTSDGTVYNYGDATDYGNLPRDDVSVSDIKAIAATGDGHGYWLVGADGGVFSFGDAPFEGSAGAAPLSAPVVGLAPTQSGQGYWLAQANGGSIFFGDAADLGNASGLRLNAPMVNEGD